MAPTITMKFRHAYNIVRVLGGLPWDTPRSWWSAESTDIGGVTGHYVLILDLVISAILLHNPTITAITITIKVRHAYNFAMVLGGWPCDTPRSWWSAEWTDIGGVTGRYVLIWTW
jgi:hypothetical protein